VAAKVVFGDMDHLVICQHVVYRDAGIAQYGGGSSMRGREASPLES
jgi:hypothetical protein